MDAISKDSTDPGSALARRLERGEVIHFPVCPFPLPTGEDLAFLLAQELGSLKHKNISYDPIRGRAAGYVRRDADQVERLRKLLADFAQGVTEWVGRTLPGYQGGCRPDRVSYRPQEEATRRLRVTARNDLLHVDSFPSRPTQGQRILRIFANINPSEPRIWVTAEPFAVLLKRHGMAAGLKRRVGWMQSLAEQFMGLFRPGRAKRSAYDYFMLRFHDYLKKNEEFQEKARKRLWKFEPGCAWMAMTDTCSHAVLRGRFALEHSYFVSPTVLALPEESPEALLQGAVAAQQGCKRAA
jgi:hypothetical protein